MGFYGGAGETINAKPGPFRGRIEPDPAIGPNRLRECQWQPGATFKIPGNWLSGVYLGKITAL